MLHTALITTPSCCSMQAPGSAAVQQLHQPGTSTHDMAAHARHLPLMAVSRAAPLCANLSRESSPQIRKLQRVQHLHTPFSGTLAEGVSSSDLLAAMHPTPAVCGRPTTISREFIRQTEPFDRGWYAGPVGWIEDDRAEFAVAIRSALLVDDTLRFCTGAGIVAASRAESEWSELAAKSSGIIGLLHPHRAAVGS